MRARAAGLVAAALAAALLSAGCFGLAGPERSTWAFNAVQVSALAAEGFDGAGVAVAVIDTGIDLGHPSLHGVSLAYWEDLVSGVAEPYDDNGHGTAMASILVGRGNLAGGAPGVDLIVIKAIAQDGSGTDDRVAAAIHSAAQHGAEIISLSLGGGASSLLHMLGSASIQAAESAAALGILVVGSAGNDGEADDGQVAAPGLARNAVSVGAVDRNNRVAPFSSAGEPVLFQGDPDRKPEVVAPGVDITVAWLSGATVTVSGTSPAAVFVSAGLALLLEMRPQFQRAGASGVDAVKGALMDSALPLDSQAQPHDSHYGYGLFQARAAALRLA